MTTQDIIRALVAAAWTALNALEDLDMQEVAASLANPASGWLKHEQRERQKERVREAILMAKEVPA